MKIVMAAGGRFNAYHLAHQLEKRGALKKFFTFAYTKKDRSYISPKLICNNNFGSLIDRSFLKFRLSKVINKSYFNVFKDNRFDFWLKNRMQNVGKVDIFVGWAHYFLNSLPVIRKTGAKVIVECCSTHILEQQKLLQEEYRKFNVFSTPIHKKNISKILEEYNCSDYLMTCSKFTYQTFIKHGIKPEKILKVPYGVDLDFFSGEHRAKDTKFRVIFIGLMCLRKGVPYLLEAWKKLNLPQNDTELLLIGNIQKDLRPVLKKINLPKNVVFFESPTRDLIPGLYKDSSVLVLPSIEEGLSMTIAEAMACGLPVICTTNTGGEELIENEKQGFVVPIRNVDALADKILWCYKNRGKAQQMGKLGQEKVKRFTWNHYGERVFNCYKRVLNQS